MRHRSLVSILFVMLTSSVLADERVDQIRKWYGEIQSAKPESSSEVQFESKIDPTSGKMTVRRYPAGLVAIELAYVSGSHSASTEYFYFKDGGLFFVFETQSTWRFDGGTPEKPETMDRDTENRFYYDDGRCVRQLTRSAESKDADQLASLLAEAKQKVVEPDESAAKMLKRSAVLAKAKDEAAVLQALGLER